MFKLLFLSVTTKCTVLSCMSSLVLIMPTKRHVTQKLFIQTINNLFVLLDPAVTNNKRHVDDNRLTLTKAQSQVRMNNLLILSSICLTFVVINLMIISSFSNNPRQGIYFHEEITKKVDPMRKQKLVLIHIDGSAKKLGLILSTYCFILPVMYFSFRME